MRIGRFEAKIFMEGIEVSYSSSMVLYVSENTAPILKLKYVSTKNVRGLLPSTFIQVFIRDKAEGDTWFLFFDGTLISKLFSKNITTEEVELVFRGVTGFLETTKYTSYNISDPISGMQSDVVMVNMGQQSDSDKTIPFRNPAGGASVDFLSAAKWKELVDKGSGFAELMRGFMEGVPMNTPFFKVLQDSMKVLNRYKLYNSNKLFELAKQILGFSDLQRNMVMETTSQPYKTLLSRIASLSLCRFIDLGIPSYVDSKEIINSVMVQTNEYSVPPIFNIIYSDEFNSYQINFDFENEPTRLLNSAFSVSLGAPMGFTGLSIMPTFLSPVKELLLKPIQKDSSGKVSYYLKFTEEEKYRGVNPIVTSSNPYEYAYASMEYNKNDKGTNENTLSHLMLTEDELIDFAKSVELGGKLGFVERMLFITEMLYIRARLESRGAGSITVPYFNPSWMIGFPGIIVTPLHGPILANFAGYVVSVDAQGQASTTLSINKPRFLNDSLAMDQDIPDWYESYMRPETIGKEFYNSYSKYGDTKYKEKGCSIIDVFGTKDSKTPIEDAAKIIASENGYIDYELRKRRYVPSDKYFHMLKVKTDANGNPDLSKKIYRSSAKLEASLIAKEAGTISKWLESPYVKERADKVNDWVYARN